MKIRSSFVSNSSSSSYIIEFEDLFKTIRIAGEEISVKDFFDAIQSNQYDQETEMHECTYYDSDDNDDLIERIDSKLEWAEDEYKVNLIELKKDIDANRDNKKTYFARFDLSYHNHALNFLFRLLKKYELFTVRDSSEE